MERIPLIGPYGAPVWRFGTNAWKQRQYKDFFVSLEWRMVDGRPDKCMVIWSARPNSHDAGAYVIAFRAITKFSDEHMRPTPYAFAEAPKALEVLGRSPLEFEVRALVDTILAHIDDLVHMPVAPQSVRRAIARAPMWELEQRTQDGRTVRETTA